MGKPGEVSEWFKVHAWKACVRLRVPWVRIPPSPPIFNNDAVAIWVPCRRDPGSGRLAAREPGQALTGAAMSVSVGVLRAPVFALFEVFGVNGDEGISGHLRGVVVAFSFHLTACGVARARFR